MCKNVLNTEIQKNGCSKYSTDTQQMLKLASQRYRIKFKIKYVSDGI